jgi:hypothetical protein
VRSQIPIADEVWIALAVLHRSQPDRESFSQREIIEQVRAERVHPEVRTGVQWHISLHCVANLPPNPAKLKMLYKLADGTYRLYRPGDDSHPQRTGRSHPKAADLPQRHAGLADWYVSDYCRAGSHSGAQGPERDPVLAMKGVGKEIWAGIDADAFVRQLRADPPEPLAPNPSAKKAEWKEAVGKLRG